MSGQDASARAFDDFRAEVLLQERLDLLADEADVERDWLESAITVSLAEAEFTVGWLDRWLPGRDRVLEVGAGLGLTSAFLASRGVHIESIEPGGSGFEAYERVNPLIRSSLGISHPHRAMPVEAVDPGQLGTFDLVFSNNVLEHVDDVDAALGALSGLLAVDGVMVHNCPNYHVPFEPHFGIPLLPVRPSATERLLPTRITSTGLWHSLNFVTARQVRRIARDRGATVAFEKGVLADAVTRLSEPEFAARHGALGRVAGVLALTVPVLRRIPASASTPMVFSWRNGQGG